MSENGFQESGVTIVITAYNSERYISRCIESVLSQKWDDMALIVVDDGSTDDTANVVKSYGEKAQLVQLKKNSGPAVGRTVGLMMADTEFVTFIDADDFWEPGFIDTTVNFLQQNKNIVAVNTGYKKIEWSGETFVRPELFKQDQIKYEPDGAIHENFYKFWATYKSTLTGTVMMRTEFAQKTEGQREDLRLTQDLEFWGYLATFGKWAFIPKPLFVTDQAALTAKERLEKFKRRFTFFSTLSLERWTERIYSRLSDEEQINHFNFFTHHIFTTIVFANAYSFKFRKSYKLVKANYDMLEKRGWGKGLRVSYRLGPLFWPIGCILLRLREIGKAYFTGTGCNGK